ncbi:MAG: DUF4349 domain-containing protein [Ginsengibacter sp.]
MKKILVFFFALLILASCNRLSKNKQSELSSQDMVMEDKKFSPPMPGDKTSEKQTGLFKDTSSSPQPPAISGSTGIDWDKKIIKTANLKIEVKDFKSFTDVVHKAAKQYGGYISNEEQNQSDEMIESILSIKVPVDQFESLLNQLPSNDSKIIERKITTEDVTGEVVDTKSRLQAKEQMRLKYLEFLKQSKTMEDVLKVQSEINEIQEEMESGSTRINYLSHQSAFSTINLTFYQPFPGYIPTDKTPGFSFRIVDAFKTGLSFITEIFIGIISIWPILLIALLILILYKKRNVSLTSSKQRL